MVSSPVARWIAIDAIKAFIRARAIGLSFTSTNPTTPESRSVLATSIIASFVPPFGRIELDAHDPVAGTECASELRLLGRRRRCLRLVTLASLEGHARLAVLVEGEPDRLDLGRCRATAPTDDAGSESDGLRGEVTEVLGCRVRIDHATADDAREADVRERCERETVATHRIERRQGCMRAGAVIRADRSDIELCQPRGCSRRLDASGDLGLVVECEQRHDRERRDGPHRLDRRDELVEIEERLDHEQIDTASLEHARLLRVQRPVLVRIEDLELAERADRAGDPHVAAGHLARLPRQADRRRVDRLELLIQQLCRELAPVRTERVGLDQLGAGPDVARMDGDDTLRRAQVRLLGAAQAGCRAGEQRTHAAVGDDRWAASQPFEKIRHTPECRAAGNQACRSTPTG